jgi:cation diffusion facilitator family transporter
LSTRELIAKRVAWISVWGNIILTIGKLIVGSYGKSEAVFVDGLHSGADVFTSIIVLLVIKIANKPADKEHPYGHGKAEVIVSGIIGIILILVSVYVVFEGVQGFLHPTAPPTIIAMFVALFSFTAKEYLYRYSLKASRKYKSKAIEAVALDHKADIVASLAAAVGVFLSIIGNKLDIHYFMYGDRVASIFVAFLIFKIAKDMLMEAFDILLERNIEVEVLQDYIAIISTFEEVKRIDRIRGRELGHYILVDLRIAIDGEKTIKEGHDLAKRIKLALINKHDNIQEVLIHLNPYFSDRN